MRISGSGSCCLVVSCERKIKIESNYMKNRLYNIYLSYLLTCEERIGNISIFSSSVKGVATTNGSNKLGSSEVSNTKYKCNS